MQISPIKFGAFATSAVVSLALVTTSALAAPSSNPKPGWGFGDDTHIHTGPPGLSDFPDVDISRNTFFNIDDLGKNLGKIQVNGATQTFISEELSKGISKIVVNIVSFFNLTATQEAKG